MLSPFGMSINSRFLPLEIVWAKAFFWTKTAEGFVFWSEIKATMADPSISGNPNFEAIDTYLTPSKYVPSPLTAFEGLHKLSAGHWLTCDVQRQMKVERYCIVDPKSWTRFLVYLLGRNRRGVAFEAIKGHRTTNEIASEFEVHPINWQLVWVSRVLRITVFLLLLLTTNVAADNVALKLLLAEARRKLSRMASIQALNSNGSELNFARRQPVAQIKLNGKTCDCNFAQFNQITKPVGVKSTPSPPKGTSGLGSPLSPTAVNWTR